MTLTLSSCLFIISGVFVTLKYSLVSIFFGLILGFLLALIKIGHNNKLKLFANFYTSIFRGTPLLIQLSIIYYALPSLFSIKLDVFSAGIITFSLNSAAYVSEIFKSGINSVDIGQFEAAQALGVPQKLIMRDIIIPQALKNIFPALINELIDLVKESTIISMIGEMDLMRRAHMVSLETYSYSMPMLVAAITYYILILILNKIAVYYANTLR